MNVAASERGGCARDWHGSLITKKVNPYYVPVHFTVRILPWHHPILTEILLARWAFIRLSTGTTPKSNQARAVACKLIATG